MGPMIKAYDKSPYLVPVQCRRLCIITLRDGHGFVPVGLTLEELSGIPIATDLHLLQFYVLPLVHRHRADER